MGASALNKDSREHEPPLPRSAARGSDGGRAVFGRHLVTEEAKKKRRRGRPAGRVMKLDATMEEVPHRMFANATKPAPSIRVYSREEESKG